jgi:hypothetical protein
MGGSNQNQTADRHRHARPQQQQGDRDDSRLPAPVSREPTANACERHVLSARETAPSRRRIRVPITQPTVARLYRSKG